MKRLIVSSLFLVSLFATPVAFADSYTGNCNQAYGGNTNCVTTKIVVNKTVQDPKSKIYVDNLGVNDPKYAPDSLVYFKIAVTNNGNADIHNVEVKDIFPENVTFSSGPGTYDANSRTLTLNMDVLTPGQTKTVEVVGKIANAAAFPALQGIMCLNNQAKARLNDQTFQDTASFCIEKNVLSAVYPPVNVTTTPKTGAEVFSLLALLPAALSGFALRRKTLS